MENRTLKFGDDHLMVIAPGLYVPYNGRTASVMKSQGFGQVKRVYASEGLEEAVTWALQHKEDDNCAS